MSIVEPNEDSARLRLRRALQRAPLFADLDTPSMAAVERELTPLVLPGGTPLFHQGEPADAVYLVASGCLGVFRHDEDDAAEGGPALIAEIPPGNIVGEMSLLSHSQRTRSVAALRDSEVWRLSQESFDALTGHHPEVLPALMRNVAVRNAMAPSKRRRQPRTFALLPAGRRRAVGTLLGAARSRPRPDRRTGPGARARIRCTRIRNGSRAARWTTPSCSIAPIPALTPWTELCLRQADCLVVVRNADSDEPTKLPFEIEAAQPSAVFHRRRELVLLHEGHDPKPGITASQLAGGLYGQHHHVRLDLPSDFDRLARLITGHAVGIVMAGGGARAFTHIGVIKALRASGVPVDQVGGTSMGAIVAAAIAARWTDEELAERFRRSFVTANPLSDYTLPFVSLFGGRGSRRCCARAFGDMDIEDLDPAVLLRHRQPHDRQRRHPHQRQAVALAARLGVAARRAAAGQRRGPGPCRWRRDRQPAGPGDAAAGPRPHHRGRYRHRRRAAGRRGRRGGVVGLGVLPPPDVAAQGDAADPLDRPHPAALGAGLERRARDEDRAAADLLIVPPMDKFDLLDWTSFDRAIDTGYAATMQALDKARTLPIGARIFVG